MPTPTNIQNELNRHRDTNSERLKQLVDEQYNTEITRPFFLRFSTGDQEDAVGLSRLLFAKGLRLITPEPRKTDHGWRVEVAVKHNLREITQEDFICDLITLSSGVNARYECWDFLSEDSAEETQSHDSVPEAH
ncbi:hypothetical protein [Terriglobus sp.]|uniref:hypothetical protein n=1 Tax=Terriglobus sp. TaxID=1889013 RepID=UPI003AFFB8E3